MPRLSLDVDVPCCPYPPELLRQDLIAASTEELLVNSSRVGADISNSVSVSIPPKSLQVVCCAEALCVCSASDNSYSLKTQSVNGPF